MRRKVIYALALAIALLVAAIRGGRIANAGAVSLRFGWLIIAAFGLQFAVVYLPQLQAAGRYQLPAILIVSSYLMLLVGIIANHQIGGMKLIGLGLLLNFAVIVANGGFMPITPDAANELGLLRQGFDSELGVRVARSKDILLEPGQTVLWLLSDIFVTGRYVPIKTVFSVGDVISAVGLFLTVQRVTLPDRGTRPFFVKVGETAGRINSRQSFLRKDETRQDL